MRPRTDGFVAVNPTRADDADRWFLFFHYPGLHAAGMRAQEPVRILMNIKSVLHITRRMIRRKVQCGKIVPVVFYLRTFCNGKTKPPEDLHNAVPDQADGMARAQGYGISGEGPVCSIVDG